MKPVKMLILCALSLLGGVLLGQIVYLTSFDTPLPDVQSLKYYHPKTITNVYDRNEDKLAEWYLERRILTPFAKLPPILVQAIISAEDRRFFEHFGLDPVSIFRAGLKNIYWRILGEKKIQGGSTITQQLARSMFLNPRERSWSRKFDEARLALNIERLFSKEKIFELYANQVYLGSGQYGFAAAEEYYFGKALEQMSTDEAALLAGIIASPEKFSPAKKAARDRRNEVLRRMLNNKFLSEAEYKKFSELPVKIVRHENYPISLHVLELIKRELNQKGFSRQDVWESGIIVRTTIDNNLQKLAHEAVMEGLREYEKRNPDKKDFLETCLIVIENKTSHIVAYVGGRDFAKTKWDHCSQASRQPGSLFKTFVLAAALEPNTGWTLDSLVSDFPRCYGGGHQKYCPENYPLEHDRYAGMIPLRRAFAESRNAAFVWLGRKIGVARVAKMAERFQLLVNNTDLSLILGSLSVTPHQMAQAFSVFPNGGIMRGSSLILEIKTPDNEIKEFERPWSKKILDEKTAEMISRALREVVIAGTGRKATILPVKASGKTGTTARPDPENPKRDKTIDAWFCGFTDEYTACVWAGFDNSENIGSHEAGSRTALPVFIKFMERVYPPKNGPLGIVELEEILPPQ